MFDASEDRHPSAEIVAKERPELLIFCGLVGLIGCLMPLAALSWAALVTDHDFIADTVSDAARGNRKWIMDVGFYFHAAGLLGLAIAAAHAHLGRAGWSLGIFALAFLALVVVLLGLWDEFGRTSENPQGMSVHTRLTFLLGPLFVAGPLLMAKGAGGVRPAYGWAFVAAAVLWAVFAVAFKLSPDAYDGLVEKIAIAATLLWTVPLSIMMIVRGRDRMG